MFLMELHCRDHNTVWYTVLDVQVSIPRSFLPISVVHLKTALRPTHWLSNAGAMQVYEAVSSWKSLLTPTFVLHACILPWKSNDFRMLSWQKVWHSAAHCYTHWIGSGIRLWRKRKTALPPISNSAYLPQLFPPLPKTVLSVGFHKNMRKSDHFCLAELQQAWTRPTLPSSLLATLLGIFAN